MGQTLIVILLGIGLFLVGYFQIRKSRRSKSWPSAPGVITASKIDQDRATSSDDDSATLFLALEYRFEVNGQSFIGNRQRFDEKRFATTKQAKTALAKFPVGGSVQVFYDPQSPTHCVLERSNSTGWVFTVIGAAMIVLALASLAK
jgi:hypothetical protein